MIPWHVENLENSAHNGKVYLNSGNKNRNQVWQINWKTCWD